MGASALLEAYRGRVLSPVEVVRAALDRLAAVEALRPVAALCAERALEEATAAEASYARAGTKPALLGVPFVCKDLFDSADVQTAYGSELFRGHTPEADAALLARLREAGAILIAKSTTHEFAWGITTSSRAFGPARNPWDPELVPGGSSGGSAIALACRAVPLAIGSDTGGSIRIPAAFCGVCGLKPTFGLLSTEGAMPLAPTLDHAGLMARSAEDLALALGVAGGPISEERADLRGVRIGVVEAIPGAPLDQAVADALAQTSAGLAALGAGVEQVSWPGADRLFEVFTPIQQLEALTVHRQLGLYPARRAEYGDDVRGRLEAAEQVGVADYRAASEERERLRAQVLALFGDVHLLLSPVSGCGPPPVDNEALDRDGRPIPFRKLAMTYTVGQDLFGLPAYALRAGHDERGLPVGLQLSAAPTADALLLSVAQSLERALASSAPLPPAVPDRSGSGG